MKRTQAVMIRLDDAQRGELEAMATAVEIPASTLAHNAVSAMLRAHQTYGTLLLPMRMVPAAHVQLVPSAELEAALRGEAPTEVPREEAPPPKRKPGDRRRRP